MPRTNVTLGLDLGTNSIGWAVVDELEQKIVAAGVRVFPEGVDRDQQGGEQSKSQARRVARGMRRQIRRRARRKRMVRKALQSIGLLPNHPDELNELLADNINKNPYRLRAAALKRKLTKYQLGRVFLHLATRRGFLSNRKMDKTADAKGMLEEIGELHETLATRNQVLGQYLHDLDKNWDHRTGRDEERVRPRQTRRSMYETEFNAIWEKQREFHPELLTDELKHGAMG